MDGQSGKTINFRMPLLWESENYSKNSFTHYFVRCGRSSQRKQIKMINFGMLWLDNTNSPLETKILQAVTYYEKKHGKTPDTVLTHKDLESTQIGKIQTIPVPWILKHHFLIGVNNGA